METGDKGISFITQTVTGVVSPTDSQSQGGNQNQRQNNEAEFIYDNQSMDHDLTASQAPVNTNSMPAATASVNTAQKVESKVSPDKKTSGWSNVEDEEWASF